MPISTPSQITVPFATSGLKNAIPATANPVTGNAGYDAGFPATNMTPKEAGGIPPFGQDFNGILFDITVAIQYLQAGMQFPYSLSFATAVGGYPLGAIVTRTDGGGFWRNSLPNNTADPEGAGTGWQPEGSGSTSITMTSSNVTLTNLQASRGIIIISGAITSNLQLIFPVYTRQWLVVNSTTGSFSITCKTAAGSGVIASSGVPTLIYGNGTNIGASAQTGFDYLNTTRIDVAATSTVNLAVDVAPNTSNINITGTTAITGFTVASGKLYFVRFDGVLTLTNGAGLVTQSGANITTAQGDTCVIRATAANVVEVLFYTPGIPQSLGYRQNWQAFVSPARLPATTYTNTTGRPIKVKANSSLPGTGSIQLLVDGIQVDFFSNPSSTTGTFSVGDVVPSGSTYRIERTGSANVFFFELRA